MLTTIKPLYLVVLLIVIVVLVAVLAFFWWRKRRQAAAADSSGEPSPEKSAAGAAASQLEALFAGAQKVLKDSPKMAGASLSSLPAYLLVGPAGAGRTSAVERAGIEARLLAGQVHSDAAIIPTTCANIWLARQTLFIEIAPALAEAPEQIAAVLGHLRAAGLASLSGKPQPARGIILCMDLATVAAARTPDEVTALARPWHASLERASSTLGTPLPVYVLFTKIDGLGGFVEFVSNLQARDLALSALPGGEIARSGCIGATIRPFNPASGGVYGKEMSEALNREYAGICSALRDARVPVLNRQQDRAKLPAEYQFAGDFQKLQKNVVQFLVDLARPNELQVSPFLRGFYFSGTRKAFLDPLETTQLPAAAEPPGQSPLTATTMMSLSQLRAQTTAAQAPLEPQKPREITEFLFLPAVFDGVILRDTPAHLATANSSRTDRVRALAIGLAAMLCLVLLVGLTVSFIRNRGLEKDLLLGATAVAGRPAAPGAVAEIERLRLPVDRLLDYRGETPLSMRWGLYRGATLLPPAQTAYCAAIRTNILQPVVGEITGRLGGRQSAVPDPAGDFNTLKAYMMMTSHPGKADESFLSQQLFDLWSGTPGRITSPAAVELLPSLFRTYGALLPVGSPHNSCVYPPDSGLIASAQARLRALNASDRYNSLLQQAGRGLKPVSYGQLFPNDAVADPKIVPGWFTRPGWVAMQKLLEHPEESLKADAWVLGETNDLSPSQLDALAAEYKKKYSSDYAAAWRAYLTDARVISYADLKDAAAKLEKISSQSSVLLNVIGLAAEHTGHLEKTVGFQPAAVVVPAKDNFQPDRDYLTRLAELKNRLSTAAQSTGPAHEQDVQEIRRAATAAQDAVDKIAQLNGFQGSADQLVKAILLMPITQIDPLLSKQNAEAVNGTAGDMCRTWGQLSKLMPFSGRAQQNSAPLEDAQRLFQPEKGQMWQFYSEVLRESLDCGSSDCAARSNPKLKLSGEFVEFFRGMNRWSRLLYGGSPEPLMHLQVRAGAFNHVREIDLVFEDQHVTLQAGGNEYKDITWDLRKAQKLLVQGKFENDGDQTRELFRTTGTWAVFEWLFNVEPGSSGNGMFTWLPRSGTTTSTLLNNGNTESYRLDIRMGDGSGRALDRRSLTLGACVSPLAR